jgi:hypothetical protein
LKKSGFWVILFLFAAVLAAGIAYFTLRHNQPLPSVEQVETQFSREIRVIEELANEIDLEAFTKEQESLPDLSQVSGVSPVIPRFDAIHEILARTREAEAKISGSGLLGAEISFGESGSSTNLCLICDDSLNIWSPDFSSLDSGARLSFCYSGLRQLIKYEKIVSSKPDQSVRIILILPTDSLTE